MGFENTSRHDRSGQISDLPPRKVWGADWPTFADLVLKVLIGVGAVIGFLVGFNQYERGQAWQRATVIMSLMESFDKDPQIKMACQMLDWDNRPITVDKDRTIAFSNVMLLRALRVEEMDDVSSAPSSSGSSPQYTSDEVIIRDAFDQFFDFFDKLAALQSAKLIKFEDLSYFYYYLELIRDAGRYKENSAIKVALDTYIKKYNFRGIQSLLREYSKAPVNLDIMTPARPRPAAAVQ
jgi:hypothetical protein